ncbi:PD-(D/E)XK nuclease family transposase [Pedobacter sp. N36a]|nr:PD-(D/E)XK nuclease family transposase [Pedobacter sp. N36a]
MNKATAKLFYIKLGFKFIELPSFNKTESELETDLDKWLYILKHMNTFTKTPVSFQRGVYFKFFQEAELIKMSKEERAIYDSNWKCFNDYENSIEYTALKAAIKAELKISRSIAQN